MSDCPVELIIETAYVLQDITTPLVATIVETDPTSGIQTVLNVPTIAITEVATIIEIQESSFIPFGNGDDEAARAAYALRHGYELALTRHHVRLTYAAGLPLLNRIWSDVGETDLRFTRAYTYIGDLLQTVVTTDIVRAATLTETYGWTGDELTTIDEVVT